MHLLWVTTIATAGPDAEASCDALAKHYQRQTRPRSAERAGLWWVDDDPCPVGSTLAGAPPPEGEMVWCEDKRMRRQGPRTTFVGGRIDRQTHWEDDLEVGVRVEWDPSGSVRRTTAFKNGEMHGERIEWALDASVTVTQVHKGEQDGATWHIDATGVLDLVEHWDQGRRSGRSCAWRDGVLEVDQRYEGGEPVGG